MTSPYVCRRPAPEGAAAGRGAYNLSQKQPHAAAHRNTANHREELPMDMKSDVDPQETREWQDAIEGVIDHEGPERAHFLIEQVIDKSRRRGAYVPFSANTAYINTIPVDRQPHMPGDPAIEEKIRNYARWNAMAMVLRANKHTNVGGHIASYVSAATLYDVGFNYFWHAPSADHGGDLVFVQGHSSPGIYARAFMLGRFTAEQMDNFRQEGDGEMDEPESMGAIGMAGREMLDNLLFVVNCNLQRLDGPVRGNGKIIQEL